MFYKIYYIVYKIFKINLLLNFILKLLIFNRIYCNDGNNENVLYCMN